MHGTNKALTTAIAIRNRILPSSVVSSSSSPLAFSSYGKWVPDDEKYANDGVGMTVYSSYAKSYDIYRPSYTHQLWRDAVGENSNSRGIVQHAVDVAAGTGRGARALKHLGIKNVTAVDLDVGMLAEIGEGIDTIHASAESMPMFANGSVDLITCLQAFHWLDASKTLDEFDRILKPKTGRVVIAWNDRDLEDDFVDAFETLVEEYNPKYSRELKLAETYVPSMEHASFEIKRYDYPNEQALTANDFVKQLFTFSYVKNALGGEELEGIERDTRKLLLKHFGLEGDDSTFSLKWTTKAFFLDKLR